MLSFRWRMLATFSLISAASLLYSGALRAQTGKISGRATDAKSGEAIEGVQIHVQGTGFGAITNATGRYFIISVPPGTYTVSARRIGYSSVEESGVVVRIDVTRDVNFALSTAANQLTTVRVQAAPVPLVEAGITGSSAAIPSEVITQLPVTSVAGVLALQQGFLEVPQNTDIVSFSDSRRQVQTPLRIRGGRGGETLTLIDGIPINNVIFGGQAFDFTTTAVQQIDYQKGGFEPQYGNALSGIINIATRQGGTALAGNVEYQRSGLGGLASQADELRGFNLFRGYLSGPVPGSADRLRFMVAGQTQSGADQVLRFDNSIANFNQTPGAAAPKTLDLFAGNRAVGYNSERDIFGKLTFLPTPTTTFNLTAVNYERQRQPFDFDYLEVGFNPLTAPGVRTLIDTLGVLGSVAFGNVVQGSIRASDQLYIASVDQHFGRTTLKLRGARLTEERQTCNFFQGVCLAARFADINFDDRFVAPGISQGQPVAGTDEFFGGEHVTSNIFRADLESQVTDHHNLQAGVFYQRHDIRFAEARNLGTNDVAVVPQRYTAKPFDAASYFQDKIEYDFLTVKLGARFDYGRAAGSGFRNPLDPSNGTTAREVCQGQAPTLGATTVFTLTRRDSATGQTTTFTGLGACTESNALRDSAAAIAQRDDFLAAEARRLFSPRIGVSFPLTEHASLFFNFGRYSQNPLYNNLYQNTNVGTNAGAAGGYVCKANQVKPGTTECVPTIFADAYVPAFLGNPNLLIEQTTSYEVGYAAEIGSAYAVNATLFSKDQTGLSGIRQSRAVQDIASTYGTSQPKFFVIVNQDFGTTRGIELQFRRRITNYWGFDVNYSFAKSTTNAAPPDRQQQSLAEGDPAQLREITSEIDQPHKFNASLFFRVDERTPTFRFGNLLRNSYATVTTQAASGLPYTPVRSFLAFNDQDQAEVNSGRGPSTFQTDVLLGKDLRFSNLLYGLFVRAVNVFDTKNCIQVFATTGRCDAGTIDQRRARNGNSVNENTASTFYDRPEFYGMRRSIYAGAKLTF